MKKLVLATTVTACIALCAAVWAQSDVIEENTRGSTDSRRVRRRNDQCGTRSGRRTYADRE